MPAAIRVRLFVVVEGRTARDAELWQRDPHHDQTFPRTTKKGVKLPFDEVQRIYETEWTSAGYEDEYQEAEYKKDGLEQLKVFHAAMLQDPPDILEQEKGFELPLENNVILTGRMDQVNSLGRKDVEIVDYKTGKPKKDADARKDLQLS